MGFKKIENSINFCLFCLIVFFGVSQLLLISNYVNIPKRGGDPNYIYGFNFETYYTREYPDFWRIDLGTDHKITNIENIIIWIFMFWGFLRVIDLERILERYKKDI